MFGSVRLSVRPSVCLSVCLKGHSKWLGVQNGKCLALPKKTHETQVQRDLPLPVQGLCLCL